MGRSSDAVEVLGVDTWSTVDGLTEHYGDEQAMTEVGSVLKGAPDATVWEQAVGFNEW